MENFTVQLGSTVARPVAAHPGTESGPARPIRLTRSTRKAHPHHADVHR
jgi:hypothetical protein